MLSSIYCQCSCCNGEKALSVRTIRAHLERDKKRLEDFENKAEYESSIIEITTYIRRNQELLQSKANPKGKRDRASRHASSSKPHFNAEFDNEMDIDSLEQVEDEVENRPSVELPERDLEYSQDFCGRKVHIDSDGSDSASTTSEETELLVQTNVGTVDDTDIDIVNDLSQRNSNDLEKSTHESSHEFIPEAVVELRERLREGYTCPQEEPKYNLLPRSLTETEETSLAHYIAWWKTNSTTQAYNYYKTLLTNKTGNSILSLHSVRKLAESLVDFQVVMMDMCPMSCMAYTGVYANLTRCTHETKKDQPCNESRYRIYPGAASKLHKKPSARKQFAILPVMATIRALFANENSSKQMRWRDSCLQQALNLVGTASMYKDFATSNVHIEHNRRMNLFKDPRDVAFALSSDGAQLTMKRQSNTWIVILILLNLPGEMRYKSENVIINLAIPGPNSPHDLDSFIYPLFQEMARASEGIWLWDAVDSSYFVLRACITMVLGDMLGSAKLSGMAGHTAVRGDRFSLVQGAKTSEKGSKRIYYPLSPPETETYNGGRPVYDLGNLPLRTEKHYWETIFKLKNASSDAQRLRITQETGISRLSFCTASPAFQHPSFFPFDPFHLFYENCMAYLWDLWATITSPGENGHISKSTLSRLGEQIPPAMRTLPPAFCGPVRDIHSKRQSQYKIYEWMALLHWYLVPMLLESGVTYTLIDNFARFVNIVEYSMTITERSEADLKNLSSQIKTFLIDFERLYVGDDPGKVSRCRLCIFQLIHIPDHIRWNGSVRLGSQATVERSIGELGHRIRSRKAPFANLTRLVKEKELIKLLRLYYPRLEELAVPRTSPAAETLQMFSRQPPSPKKKLQGELAYKTLDAELAAIKIWLVPQNQPLDSYERWGKIKLGRYMLRSSLLEIPEDPLKRHYRWFKAQGKDIFGEAVAFYRVNFRGNTKELVIYKPLVQITILANRAAIRGVWSNDLRVLETSQLVNVVGIWRVPDIRPERVYVLQKHSGLEMLIEHMPDRAEAESEDSLEVE